VLTYSLTYSLTHSPTILPYHTYSISITDEQADAAYADLINTTMEQRGIENLSSEELDQLDKGGTMYVISYLFINILLLLIFILYKVGKRCQDNSK